MGRSGSLSRQSRGIDPHVEIRRREMYQIKLFWETQCSSRVRLVCCGTFGVTSRVSSTVSNFKREHGISLEMLSEKGPYLAMTGKLGRISRVVEGFSRYNMEHRDPLMLPQGSPISIRVAKGSLRLHSSHCRPNRPHLGLCPETPCSSPVATGISGLHSRFTRGVRTHLKWKQRIPLSFELRRVSLGAH